MAKQKTKKKTSAGAIVGIVVAVLLLLAVFAGVIYYVHSGNAGRQEAAGVMDPVSTTLAEQKTTEEETTVADEETTAEAEETTKAKASSDTTAKPSLKADTTVTYKSKLTAKKLAKYFTTSPEATYNAYDGKTVTLSGTLSDKSAKMLYVELATGAKVPCRIYLNSEDQREQFNAFSKGDALTVKGTAGIILPTEMDAGGFQEMANGCIALEDVTLVK